MEPVKRRASPWTAAPLVPRFTFKMRAAMLDSRLLYSIHSKSHDMIIDWNDFDNICWLSNSSILFATSPYHGDIIIIWLDPIWANPAPERSHSWKHMQNQCKTLLLIYVPRSKLLLWGMDIPPLIGNPQNGYIIPYCWVDEVIPYYIENNGSLDPIAHICSYHFISMSQ